MLAKKENKDREYVSFDYYDDNDFVGYYVVKEGSFNNIYVFVNEEFRGNGYGSILFKDALEYFKNINYDYVNVSSPKDDVRMDRIIKHYTCSINMDNEICYNYNIKL